MHRQSLKMPPGQRHSVLAVLGEYFKGAGGAGNTPGSHATAKVAAFRRLRCRGRGRWGVRPQLRPEQAGRGPALECAKCRHEPQSSDNFAAHARIAMESISVELGIREITLQIHRSKSRQQMQAHRSPPRLGLLKSRIFRSFAAEVNGCMQAPV